jgi:hypothetical protein
MVGFEIHIDDQVVYASLDKGLLPVILSHVKNYDRVGKTFLSVTGTKRFSFEQIRWFFEEVNDVKKIVIKVVDVKENSEFWIRVDDRNEMLKKYYSLKEKLKEYL